jgi:hypothetical protein
MRVSFDSNVWEDVFRSKNQQTDIIREALVKKKILGAICDAGFRIEIKRSERVEYFGRSHLEVKAGYVDRDGQSFLKISLGPNDSHHPSLPPVQADRLKAAFDAGMRLMRGVNWMWLPRPPAILDPLFYIPETPDAQSQREQRQASAFDQIRKRGVGLGLLDSMGGWEATISNEGDAHRYIKACAEWGDGEVVAAHIAYQNEILCTGDKAKSGGPSVFDESNRAWLSSKFGVVFMTLRELATEVGK